MMASIRCTSKPQLLSTLQLTCHWVPQRRNKHRFGRLWVVASAQLLSACPCSTATGETGSLGICRTQDGEPLIHKSICSALWRASGGFVTSWGGLGATKISTACRQGDTVCSWLII